MTTFAEWQVTVLLKDVTAQVAPNIVPTADATPIDSALQKVTRNTPGPTFAPPTRAASPPRTARETSAVTAILGATHCCGASAVTMSGKAAPTEKLLADASAACN